MKLFACVAFGLGPGCGAPPDFSELKPLIAGSCALSSCHGATKEGMMSLLPSDAYCSLVSDLKQLFETAPTILRDHDVLVGGLFIIQTEIGTRWAGCLTPVRPISRREHPRGDASKQSLGLYAETALDEAMSVAGRGKLFVTQDKSTEN